MPVPHSARSRSAFLHTNSRFITLPSTTYSYITFYKIFLIKYSTQQVFVQSFPALLTSTSHSVLPYLFLPMQPIAQYGPPADCEPVVLSGLANIYFPFSTTILVSTNAAYCTVRTICRLWAYSPFSFLIVSAFGFSRPDSFWCFLQNLEICPLTPQLKQTTLCFGIGPHTENWYTLRALFNFKKQMLLVCLDLLQIVHCPGLELGVLYLSAFPAMSLKSSWFRLQTKVCILSENNSCAKHTFLS
jgi:hypothetical protein